jgi:hypothetical protein
VNAGGEGKKKLLTNKNFKKTLPRRDQEALDEAVSSHSNKADAKAALGSLLKLPGSTLLTYA